MCASTRCCVKCQIGRRAMSPLIVRNASSTCVNWMYIRQSAAGSCSLPSGRYPRSRYAPSHVFAWFHFARSKVNVSVVRSIASPISGIRTFTKDATPPARLLSTSTRFSRTSRVMRLPWSFRRQGLRWFSPLTSFLSLERRMAFSFCCRSRLCASTYSSSPSSSNFTCIASCTCSQGFSSSFCSYRPSRLRGVPTR